MKGSLLAGAFLAVFVLGFAFGEWIRQAELDDLLTMAPGSILLNHRTNAIISRLPDDAELFHILRIPTPAEGRLVRLFPPLRRALVHGETPSSTTTTTQPPHGGKP